MNQQGDRPHEASGSLRAGPNVRPLASGARVFRPARSTNLLATPLLMASLCTGAAAQQGTNGDEQWRRCLYVYAEGPEPNVRVRECLVLTFGWQPAAAETRIARYQDSVDRAEQARLEAAGAEAQARLARQRADDRRADSLWFRDHRELATTGAAAPIAPERLDWWVVDTRTGAYYSASCPVATRIPSEKREFFSLRIDAAADGHWPSRVPGCATDEALAEHRAQILRALAGRTRPMRDRPLPDASDRAPAGKLHEP